MQDVADYLGVAKSTYAGYEAGFRQPTIESIQKICRKLRTSADYLFGLTDDSQPASELNHNIREYLNYEQLHWEGVPLQQEDLALIRYLLERLAVPLPG